MAGIYGSRVGSGLESSMPIKRTLLPDAVERYVVEEMSPETPVERALRAATAKLPDAQMQIGADQGAFMALLVRLMGARRCIEIGTFTGYSALAVAAALPEGGTLVACDVSEEWTGIAREYWASGGVGDRITLELGPARETLDRLIREGGAGRRGRGRGSFDFAFIDADKVGYDAYYERCLTLLRPGGLIAMDNALQDGKVADPSNHEENTEAIRSLNAKVRDDPRVEACLVTIGDGLLLARKR
jgi:predicted O-methyltransferase YrrM